MPQGPRRRRRRPRPCRPRQGGAEPPRRSPPPPRRPAPESPQPRYESLRSSLRLVNDLGIDHLLLGGAQGAVARRGAIAGRLGLLGLSALVHLLADPVERGLQRLGLGLD